MVAEPVDEKVVSQDQIISKLLVALIIIGVTIIILLGLIAIEGGLFKREEATEERKEAEETVIVNKRSGGPIARAQAAGPIALYSRCMKQW